MKSKFIKDCDGDLVILENITFISRIIINKKPGKENDYRFYLEYSNNFREDIHFYYDNKNDIVKFRDLLISLVADVSEVPEIVT
jgi:hypothetical protein